MNSDNVARVIRIRPTAAAMQEPEDDPHYVPKDPRNLLKADPTRRLRAYWDAASVMRQTGAASELSVNKS